MKWSLPKGLDWWREVLSRYKAVFLVLLAGLILLLLPSGGGAEDEPAEPSAVAQTEQFDLAAFEDRLSRILSQIEGAGEVQVVLTLRSGSRQVLAQDMERDGERTVTSAVTVGRSSAGQEVVAVQTLSPQFQGALVVCPGGDDSAVRLALSQSVAALTGLGADKIAICKGN